MSTAPKQQPRVDQFFTGAEARHDRWRTLLRQSRQWESSTTKQGAEAKSYQSQVLETFEELRQWEGYFAYPGLNLLATLKDRITSGDAVGTTRLARAISTAIVTHSYRTSLDEWEREEDSVGNLADRLPLSGEQRTAYRPYFEVLFVSPARQSMWADLGHELRKLRRPQDKFAYESVFVGSFEDAILAFSPDLRRRRFHVPLRNCDFYEDRALCRDVRRKLEFWLDPAALHTFWDRTWNQWKHLLGTKIEVEGTFVQTGKYRKRREEWELVTWETALPSRVQVKLPPDFQQQAESAKTTYHRFGQYSRALDQIRLCLEHRAVERTELQRMCSELRIPSAFEVAHISWRPDYDPFFYRQLSRRARRIYLLREEYIFDVEKAVVVETPQLGHATYVFAKPRSMDSFLALYTKITKDDIRRNRNNAAEGLGFLGRVIHGGDPRAWLREVRQRIGEKVDSAAVGSE